MQKSVSIAGVKYYYWLYANPKAKYTIIMIHGYRGTHHGLELIAHYLTDFNIIVPDLPGFGLSPALAHSFADDYANWLNQFIDNLSLKSKPVLLGHSFGSIIASNYASQYSQNIDRLILLNPISSATTEEFVHLTDFYYKVGQLLPESLGRHWFSSKILTVAASEIMMRTHNHQLRHKINQQHLAHFSDFYDTKSLVESYRASSRGNVSQYATAIKIPTLLIAGECDKIAPVSEARKLQKLFPDAQLHIIANVGHLTHYETPQRVATLVRQFINQSDVFSR